MQRDPHEHECSNCGIGWPCRPGPDGCRIHHRDLCPQCAREARDNLRAELRSLAQVEPASINLLQGKIKSLNLQVDELKKALIEHHSKGRCRCADFGFWHECKCWLSLNTGPNGECEKCQGIRKSNVKCIHDWPPLAESATSRAAIIA